MSSPAKKRKLNKDSKPASVPTRGLEYFFSKQKQNGNASVASGSQTPGEVPNAAASAAQDQELADEELARKLQAEWDQEVAAANANGGNDAPSPTPETVQIDAEESIHVEIPPVSKSVQSKAFPALEQAGQKGKGTLSLQSVAASVDAVSESIPFDESPLTFEPSKYISQLKQHWASEDGNASYALLTRCFVLVSSTQSRIKIVDTLVNCLRVLIEADPESLLPAVSVETKSVLLSGMNTNSSGRSGWRRTPSRRPTYHLSSGWVVRRSPKP
jgi:DNA ligase-1